MLALGIYVFQLTGSPSLVALIAIVRMLPYALLGMVIGGLADHVDRKRLLVTGQAVAFLSAASMAVLAAAGLATYPVVLLATALLGIVWVTDMPVRRRLIADTVGPERLSAALGLDNATNYAMRAVGPLLGGLVYQWLGVVGIFALSAGIYLSGLVLALRVTRPAGHSGAGAPLPRLRALFALPPELMRSRAFLVFLGVTAVFNLWCIPVLGMVPVIAQKDFALGPAAIGALAACDGIGGTMGALIVGAAARQATLINFYTWGTLGFLILLLVLSLWLTVPAAVAVFLLVGMCSAFFSATQYALVYSLAPPEARGRATGVLSLFISLATIGHFHTGLMFDWFPTTTALQIITLEGLAVMAVLLWLGWRK